MLWKFKESYFKSFEFPTPVFCLLDHPKLFGVVRDSYATPAQCLTHKCFLSSFRKLLFLSNSFHAHKWIQPTLSNFLESDFLFFYDYQGRTDFQWNLGLISFPEMYLRPNAQLQKASPMENGVRGKISALKTNGTWFKSDFFCHLTFLNPSFLICKIKMLVM